MRSSRSAVSKSFFNKYVTNLMVSLYVMHHEFIIYNLHSMAVVFVCCQHTLAVVFVCYQHTMAVVFVFMSHYQHTVTALATNDIIALVSPEC